jgi:molybdopterin converting factor small subunit
MRRIFVLILVIFTLLQWSNFADATSLNEAYKNQQSNIQVKGSGKVIRILNDDNKGSRHQKFILKLNSGNTILIAHNIDLAPKIHSISDGDTVQFYGEYEWNKKGGVVHWTHRDPNRHHISGWLRHKGNVYQ